MKEIELIEKRGKKEKHFLQKDGTIVAKMYSNDIHYFKDGKFEEIDNTLIKKDNYFCNSSNNFKVYYNEHSSNTIVRMEKENDYLEMKLKDSNDVFARKEKQNSKLISNIIYKDILDGIDIKYQTTPNKVKETIVINKREKIIDKLNFLVNTNLELSIDKNSIIAKKDNNVIFEIEQPYMFDSNNNINNNIFYNLKKFNGIYELELTLDSEWLNSNDTIFPVSIDPTISNFIDGGNVYDTYIYPNDTNVDRNSKNILKAGVERLNGVDYINRTLVKFDLPKIGTGSEIIFARLQLISFPAVENKPNNNKLVTIHRITKDWDEKTANWSTMNDKYSSKVESIYYCSRSFTDDDDEIVTVSSPYNDITNLVKKWYTGTPNYGIMIKSPNEVYIDDNFPAFISKNSDETSNLQPTLEIVYRNQNGLEEYLEYKEQCFENGKTYVNCFNGNLTGIWNLGSTVGSKLKGNLDLVYNTNDVVLNNNTIYGKGYRLNLDQTIRELKIEEQDYLEYIDDDGTIHYFIKDLAFGENDVNTSNVYYDEDGLNLSIEKIDSDYIMTDQYTNKMTFTKFGTLWYLTSITNISNNILKIERNDNNLITKICDENSSEINVNYESNCISVESSYTTTKINYNNKNVVSIQTEDGITNFEYNNNNLINCITDVTGMKNKYDYYEEYPFKIKKVTQYGLNDTLGNFFSLNYGFLTTTIIDHFGKQNTLIFNSNGNVLSNNSLFSSEDINNAYSITQYYGEDKNVKNKLLKDTIPVRYVKNYIKNSSFEEETLYFSSNGKMPTGITDECSYSGNRCFSALSTSNDQFLSYTLSVPKGKYYTFSGYFKNQSKIELCLSYLNKDGIDINSYEEVEISDNFERSDVTIFYAEDALTDLSIVIKFHDEGMTYIDDIQLEEGEVVNNYNIIENSDFSDGLDDWNLSAHVLDSFDDISVDTNKVFELVNFNDNKNTALKVKMDPFNYSSFSKEFIVKGKSGDLYRISFWYKNEGINGDGEFVANNVTMYFIPADGSQIEQCVMPSTEFNNSDNIWQYFSYDFVAEWDYKSIILDFHQGRNANDFYITNLTLFKDLATNYYEYDVNGNISSIKDNVGNSDNKFGYNKDNQLLTVTGLEGENLKYEYDNEIKDRVLSSISSNGLVKESKYDSFGNETVCRTSKKWSKELSNGSYRIRVKGTNKYLRVKNTKEIIVDNNNCSDPIWNLEKIDNKYKIIFSEMPNYSFAYLEGNIYLTTSNKNNLFVFEPRDNGSCYIKLEDEDIYLKMNNNFLEFSPLIYNDSSFEFYLENVCEEFIEEKTTYTTDGRFITSKTDSNSNTTYYDIDEKNGLTKSITNPKNQTTYYEYDSKKNITSITNKDRKVTFNYNSSNQLNEIIFGNKNYKFSYDNFLNNSKVTIGDSITLVTNEYKENNESLSKVIYGNKDEILFNYDEFSRLNNIIKSDDKYKLKYDNNGNLTKILSNNYTEKYSYDIGKKIKEYRFNDFRINYNYSANNKIVGKKIKLKNYYHNIDNELDSNINVIKTTLDESTIYYNYDSLGRLISKNIGNNFDLNYKYKLHGKKSSLLIDSLKNGDDIFNYKYDKLNNITDIYCNGILLKSYYYDDYNELIKELDFNSNIQINYIYNLNGNLLRKTITNIETLEIIDECIYSYDDVEWEDKLTKINEQMISYDMIGNPASIGNNILLKWKNGRELNSYNDIINNLYVEYKYNKDGIRIGKKVNNTEINYYLEDKNIIFEKRGNDLIYYLYDHTGIVGLSINGTKYYYVKNLQNDIVGILNEQYVKVVNYEYDSWGNILSIKDENGIEIIDNNNIGHINPFRYRSYYYDEETKLYYLNSRYYNPKWCRFINADSILVENNKISGYNLYEYCHNNPINYSDPDGNFPFEAALAVLGISTGELLTVLGILGLAMFPSLLNGLKGIAVNLTEAVQAAISKTRKLPDTKASKPKKNEKVYFPATVNKKNKLVIVPTPLTFEEAEKQINALRLMNGSRKAKIGIYTLDQAHARALAEEVSKSGTRLVDVPETHGYGPNYYGHYHDIYHTVHIWYGNFTP